MSTTIQPHEIEKIVAADQKEATHATGRMLELVFQDALLNRTFINESDPINRNCRKNYHARHSSGTRPLSEIWWVVLHDTEGPNAQSAAIWFENPNSQGSAHCCVDNNVCYQTLDDNEIPWAAPGANYHGYHIEQAGYASWTKIVWSKAHRDTIKRAAYRAAVRCKRYNIPIRFCDAEMLRAGKKGITTHAQCTKAFGGNHTDPGAGYPMKLFLWYTRYYFNRITL